MASVSKSGRKHFLLLYESYQRAKKKNGPVIWAKAVLCKQYLEKIAAPDKQEEIFEQMFEVEQSAECFRKLCEDSKSSAEKSLASPLTPETISVLKVLHDPLSRL
jgi:hypothetical protein